MNCLDTIMPVCDDTIMPVFDSHINIYDPQWVTPEFKLFINQHQLAFAKGDRQ